MISWREIDVTKNNGLIIVFIEQSIALPWNHEEIQKKKKLRLINLSTKDYDKFTKIYHITII